MVHIHNIIDNFSRYAFASVASVKKSAVIYRDAIQNTVAAFPERFKETAWTDPLILEDKMGGVRSIN
ncbi:MAG TPA: hypothetical protein PLJ29_18900, partial [Leptospiraceae bacterium]|nr:hypothetical protein [Leptospiraceae bacterium]